MVLFTFLHLPRIPRDLIIQNFDSVDIFIFSLISKKCHALAKQVKTHVECLQCVGNSINNVKNMETSSFSVSERNRVENIKKKLDDWTMDTKLDGIPVTIWKTTGFYDFLIIPQYPRVIETTLKVLYKRLTEVLKPKKLTYQFLSMSNFYPSDGLWLTEMSIDCEIIEVHNPQVESQDLEAFLNKWKEGGFPKLKELSIWWLGDNGCHLEMGPELQDNKGNIGMLEVDKRSQPQVKFHVNPTVS